MKAHKYFGQATQDARIASLIETLPKQYLGREYAFTERVRSIATIRFAYDHLQVTDDINLEDLDALSMRSMPLCMSTLHQHLRSTHHLKHVGRLQYSLFLKVTYNFFVEFHLCAVTLCYDFFLLFQLIIFKGIGITLEQAIEFWKDELGNRGGRNFEKDYAYNIKHSYGTVGKRTSYTPYSCAKIEDMTPGAGIVRPRF